MENYRTVVETENNSTCQISEIDKIFGINSSDILVNMVIILVAIEVIYINPSNAEATFVQSTRMQRFLKII